MLGGWLRFPRQSKISGSDLHELRPCGGRKPLARVYRRIDATFVIDAIAREAGVDPRGSTRPSR
jgi:hypothetical protein